VTGMDLSGTAINHLLEALSAERRELFFVQVGSNDGEHNDPLAPFITRQRWRGIMVEPVPYVFDRLKRNYQHRDDLVLVNAAVSNHDGFSDFHCLAESRDSLPEWYDQLGSFTLHSNLDSWVEEIMPDIRERIISIKVPCTTFETLCRKYRVDRIDLVHIDAEGHDFEIIKGIDFDRHQPAVVLYEHKHLSRPDRYCCRQLLRDGGYLVLEFAQDTLCVARAAVTKPDSGLREAWQVVVDIHKGVDG
jgi:FkbM family methyltransferase